MIRKRGLGRKDNDSVFAVEMTSAIRIANWVVIKILINYLLLFHREEISAYLIGVTEMYSVPCLHKLNVKNKSTACLWEGEKEMEQKWACGTGQDPQVMQIRAALVKSLDGEAQTRDAKRGTLIWMFTGGLCCMKRRGQAGGSQQPFFQSYQISLYQNQSQQYEILFSACGTTAPTPAIPSEARYCMIFVCLFISISALHMLQAHIQ